MNRQAQAGFAMVIVIWVLSLLTIMAGSFALTMRRETVVITAIKESAEALALAEAGVVIAQQMLFTNESEQWHAEGSIYQVKFQDAKIRVRLFSEQGKIDINKADESLLMTMMSSTSAERTKQDEIVAAILDWRDSDDLVHINGAEKQQYESAGLAYHPSNKEFQLIEELQMVLGMDASIYKELEPLITIYSKRQQVNQKLASEEVMQVITDIDSTIATVDDRENFPLGNTINSVYTVISQVRFNGETEAGIKVTMKKVASVDQSNAFQVLDYQQLYQGPSLFSNEMEPFLVTEKDESELEY